MTLYIISTKNIIAFIEKRKKKKKNCVSHRKNGSSQSTKAFCSSAWGMSWGLELVQAQTTAGVRWPPGHSSWSCGFRHQQEGDSRCSYHVWVHWAFVGVFGLSPSKRKGGACWAQSRWIEYSTSHGQVSREGSCWGFHGGLYARYETQALICLGTGLTLIFHPLNFHYERNNIDSYYLKLGFWEFSTQYIYIYIYKICVGVIFWTLITSRLAWE